jgi:hypothetical protein
MLDCELTLILFREMIKGKSKAKPSILDCHEGVKLDLLPKPLIKSLENEPLNP